MAKRLGFLPLKPKTSQNDPIRENMGSVLKKISFFFKFSNRQLKYFNDDEIFLHPTQRAWKGIWTQVTVSQYYIFGPPTR